MTVLPCRKIWCSKCWKQLARSFDVLSACKKSTSSLTSLLGHCKLAILGTIGMLTIPIKNHSINLFETFMLTCMLKTNFITDSLLRYCKEIANLLFWVIWACLATPLKWQYQFEGTFDIYQQTKKSFSSFMFFLEILQQYCKFVILGTLGIPGHVPPKWYYQLVEKLCAYLEVKSQLHPPLFLEILQRYANLLFWVLWAWVATHTQNGSFNL